MDINDQKKLSEELLLLHEVQYDSDSSLDTPYQGAGIYRNRQPRYTKDEVRLLDTIAVALTTGTLEMFLRLRSTNATKCGSFWQKMGLPHLIMLLLIFLIGNLAVSNATHLFPFLIRRYGAYIDKWIRNLHTSIRELHNDFLLALEERLMLRLSFQVRACFLRNMGVRCLRLQ